MFLDFFSLKKLPFTSSASRHVFIIKHYFLVIWKDRHLSFHKRGNAGRNDSGRIIIRTKTSLLSKTKTVQINYSLRNISAGIVAHMQFIPFKNKFVSLICLGSGGLSYVTSHYSHKLFLYFHAYSPVTKFCRYSTHAFYNCLFKIPQHIFVNLLEVTPNRGAQYCRSAGTRAKIVKIDYKTFTTLVILPSGARKLFSHFSLVSTERVVFREREKLLNSKAGYWRKFGCKPIVRGVAMNPVDHPHGGRTKAIRYQRTPWGKTTKFKQ